MNYQAIYTSLIERSRGRSIDGYTERHHVVPKCLGGSNASQNIAVLTAEEHYLAHQLLVKIYPNHLGILSGAHVMTTTKFPGRVNNKLYGWLRRRMAVAQTGQKRAPAIGQKIGAKLKGRKRDPESVAKGVAKLKGRTNSPEHRAKSAASQRGRKASPKTIAKSIIAHTGKKQSAETVAKRVASCQARYAVTPKPKHSEEVRAKMRASRLAYIAEHGTALSPEVLAKRAAKMRGRPRPPEVMARCVATRAINRAAKLAALPATESAIHV